MRTWSGCQRVSSVSPVRRVPGPGFARCHCPNQESSIFSQKVKMKTVSVHFLSFLSFSLSFIFFFFLLVRVFVLPSIPGSLYFNLLYVIGRLLCLCVQCLWDMHVYVYFSKVCVIFRGYLSCLYLQYLCDVLLVLTPKFKGR